MAFEPELKSSHETRLSSKHISGSEHNTLYCGIVGGTLLMESFPAGT